MTETIDPKQFDVMFVSGTTPDQFPDIVKSFLLPDDVALLGGEAGVASQKVSDSLAYLGVFAPSPATFDKQAFMFTAGGDFPEEESERILSIAQRLGVVKAEGERFSVSQSKW